MRLRTRLILALCYLALIGVNSAGWGRPWMRILASGVFAGFVLIQMSEQRLRAAREHPTPNLSGR